MQAKLAAFRKSGAISGDDYALFSGKIAAMRAEVDKAGAATHKLTLNSAMARREFGRMGTDIAMGNYGRLSQTSLTLANYTGVMGLAFSATGAAIAGMLAPLGLLLAGYIKGEQEAAAYNKALILTGNIAGETSGQLGNMARNLSGITGSQRDAAAVLAAVASTGKFTAA
jgi:phage-related minor tail protein